MPVFENRGDISALEQLKQEDPAAIVELLEAIATNAGLAYSFRCPNCNALLELVAPTKENGPASRRRKKNATGSVFDMLVRMARLRKTTVGAINKGFRKTLGRKKLSPQEFKARKRAWLAEQLEG